MGPGAPHPRPTPSPLGAQSADAARAARLRAERRASGTEHSVGESTLDRVIEGLVQQIEARFAELSQAMSNPEVIGDRHRYAEVGREYRRLEPAAKLAEEWRRTTDDAAGYRIAQGFHIAHLSPFQRH